MKEADSLNIIAICIDALRRGDLSVYGFPFNVSPNIHNLALKSTIFSKAYSPSTWTGTVVASLFSGKPPSQHRVFRERDVFKNEIAINRRKDYFNFCLTANPWMRGEFGFNRGWDDFEYIESKEAQDIFEKFFKKIKGAASPFFSYLHFMDLHGPFDYYWKHYCKHLNMDALKRHFSYKRPRGKDRFKDEILLSLGKIKNKIRKKLDKYRPTDGIAYTDMINSITCIAKFDKLFGDFLERLNKEKLLRKTAVIVFSDHGDERNEHGGGREGHNHSLYEETVNIPFIVYLPDGTRTAVDKEFSSVQFYKIIENLQNNNLITKGLDLGAPIIGQLAFGKHLLGYLLKNNKKLIKNYNDNGKELYDLSVDPGEKNNLNEKMRQLTREYELELDKQVNFQFLDSEEQVEVDDKVKQRLRSLGYL